MHLIDFIVLYNGIHYNATTIVSLSISFTQSLSLFLSLLLYPRWKRRVMLSVISL